MSPAIHYAMRAVAMLLKASNSDTIGVIRTLYLALFMKFMKDAVLWISAPSDTLLLSVGSSLA